MKTILIGNGLDIQYGGDDYFCSSIVNRAIQNVKSGKFNIADYPATIVDHVQVLYKLAIDILTDRTFINEKAWTDEDKVALDSFCFRYKNALPANIADIGFEDYFLIQRLYYNLNYDSSTGNYQERNDYYDYLRRFFLDSIYNEGKINNIEYPAKMKGFLEQFDNIYSLNYDRNLEKITDKPIHYLHGAFHVISEKHNNDSPMNKVMGIHTDITGCEHLYSTALTTYCGKEKEELLTQADKVNAFLRVASEFQKECEKTKTEIPAQLKAIVLAKKLCPDYIYPQNYCYHLFEKISSEIIILGLSPANDDHLIKVVNSNIDHITYYFYPHKDVEHEKQIIRTIFKGKRITFLDVTDLWKSFD